MSRAIVYIILTFSLFFGGIFCLPQSNGPTIVSQLIGVQPAAAQAARKKKRRSLFNVLFGRKKTRKKAVNRKKSRRAKSSRSRRKSKRIVRKKGRSRNKSSRRSAKAGRRNSGQSSRNKRTASSSTTGRSSPSIRKAILPAVIVEKSEKARTVLVVGDFFSGSLAKGLETAFSANSEVKIVDKSKGLSGFVRVDVVDWPTQLPLAIAEVQPDFVVAMLGTNDRQLMIQDGVKLKTRSPGWDAAYRSRAEALGSALKASNIPYIWVGLPPVRFKTMNKDFLFFNDVYGKAAKSPTGKFVDVWDGFSDADGNYSRSGPDVNGQIVLLRPKDGINLTKAGRRRLAFYVQGQIAKTLNANENTFVNSSMAFDIEGSLPESDRYDPVRSGKSIVIKLDDPKIDGSRALAGRTVKLNSANGSASAVPKVKSAKPSTRTLGRVDDHSWPPRDAETSTTPALAVVN